MARLSPPSKTTLSATSGGTLSGLLLSVLDGRMDLNLSIPEINAVVVGCGFVTAYLYDRYGNRPPPIPNKP